MKSLFWRYQVKSISGPSLAMIYFFPGTDLSTSFSTDCGVQLPTCQVQLTSNFYYFILLTSVLEISPCFNGQCLVLIRIYSFFKKENRILKLIFLEFDACKQCILIIFTSTLCPPPLPPYIVH